MNMIDEVQERLELKFYHLKHDMERFSGQVKFAERFKELFPKKTTEWSNLILNAVKSIDKIYEQNDYGLIKNALRNAEEIMEPIAKFAKKYNVQCVGHAHIDMNWMWGWQETVATTNDTFSTVLKLMNEYPEFVFSQSQACVYAIIEKYNPAMLEEIKKRVYEKRWEITASHWVEGDKNMISGEALSRHILYTRNYMKRIFGLEPEEVIIDWAPDTFGHSTTVPSYLSQGGIKYCYLFRPGNFGEKRPGMFIWQGPDGSQVLVRNDMSNGYSGKLDSSIACNMVDFVKENGTTNYMFVYGIGDHGGGPTRCDLNKILEMSTWPVFPKLEFSTARSFFERFEKESSNLPILKGELNAEVTGCYTTQALIKKANRYSENRLADAEFAATISWKLLDQNYPQEKLEKSWKDCLFSHFHDIISGTGVRDTRHYTMGLFQNIMAETSMIETLALRQIASVIDTSKDNSGNKLHQTIPSTVYKDAFGAGAGIGAINGQLSIAEQSAGYGIRPFVIFNPTAFDRTEIVEVVIWDNPLPNDGKSLANKLFAVKTPSGELISTQLISKGVEWEHHYIKLAFPIKISGFAYNLYTIVENEAGNYTSELKTLKTPHHAKYLSHERGSRFGCENDYVVLEINPLSGGILRLRDKKSGLDIISPEHQLPILEFSIERPHKWSSWLIDFCDKKEPLKIRSISYMTTGPYKIAIKVESEIHSSKFTIIYEMEENNPLISINIKGTWLENGSEAVGCPTLRMPFALNLDSAEASYEIPFGAIKRNLTNDEEVPALQWAKVTGNNDKEKAGFLLVNDCKHGHALENNILRISLIRSAYSPDPISDIGEHEINLALLPFSGNLPDAECAEYGVKLNRKLKTIGTDIHKGSLPPNGQFIKIEPDNVIVSGLKKAEDKDALILRFYEIKGKNTKIKISINKMLGTVEDAVVVDLMERPIKDAACLQVKSNDIILNVKPYKIISIKIQIITEEMYTVK